MPDAELRTRISLDSTDASGEFDKLTEKAQQLRIREAAAQEKMVRDLSTMSVEEFDKQIKAEERLLDQLRIKQINDADDIRSKLVEQYAERKQEHERRIRELDIEAIKIRATGDESVEQQEKLRKVIKDRNDEMAAARDDEIKGLQDIAARTRELHVVTPAEIPGAIPTPSGGLDVAGGFTAVMSTVRGAGQKMQMALAPLLRILGPIGIAFSLEQVVEKLYKANEELRVIRNNYADIAATMGDLMGVGGLFVGKAQTEMMQLQRSFADRFADAFDEKIIPQLAATIQRAGVAPGELGGLTESAALMGMGAGINPQTIAQTFVRLYREFEIPANKLAEETALLIDAAQRLRVPFDDLAKWTLTLAEQTRIYGFDISDSRRLVTEFAHELENGTVQMQSLVQAQRAMSNLDVSSSMGIIQFLDQISGFMETAGFAEMVRGVGGPMEQSVFIRALGQGQMPIDIMEQAKTDPELATKWGKGFDVETGKGLFNISSDLLKAADKLSVQMGGEMAGGEPGAAFIISGELRKMFGEDLLGKPFAEQNAILEGIRNDDIGVKGAVEKSGTDIVAKLTDQGTILAEQRATITGTIATGIKWFWRDAAGDIGLMFRSVFGGELADVRAQVQRGGGGARAILGTGLEIEGEEKYTIGEIAQAGRAGAGAAGKDFAEGFEGFKQFMQHLITEGRVEGVDDVKAAQSLAKYFFNLGVAPTVKHEPSGIAGISTSYYQQDIPVTGTPEEQTKAFRSEYLVPKEQAQIQQITKQVMNELSAGRLGDISTKPGVQFEMGGIQINLSGYKNIDEVNKAIKDNIVRFTDEVIFPEVQRAMQENNAESGQ